MPKLKKTPCMFHDYGSLNTAGWLALFYRKNCENRTRDCSMRRLTFNPSFWLPRTTFVCFRRKMTTSRFSSKVSNKAAKWEVTKRSFVLAPFRKKVPLQEKTFRQVFKHFFGTEEVIFFLGPALVNGLINSHDKITTPVVNPTWKLVLCSSLHFFSTKEYRGHFMTHSL